VYAVKARVQRLDGGPLASGQPAVERARRARIECCPGTAVARQRSVRRRALRRSGAVSLYWCGAASSLVPSSNRPCHGRFRRTMDRNEPRLASRDLERHDGPRGGLAEGLGWCSPAYLGGQHRPNRRRSGLSERRRSPQSRLAWMECRPATCCHFPRTRLPHRLPIQRSTRRVWSCRWNECGAANPWRGDVVVMTISRSYRPTIVAADKGALHCLRLRRKLLLDYFAAGRGRYLAPSSSAESFVSRGGCMSRGALAVVAWPAGIVLAIACSVALAPHCAQSPCALEPVPLPETLLELAVAVGPGAVATVRWWRGRRSSTDRG
jgi:hypothetical protein